MRLVNRKERELLEIEQLFQVRTQCAGGHSLRRYICQNVYALRETRRWALTQLMC